MKRRPSRDEIRHLVRDLLREAVPGKEPGKEGAAPRAKLEPEEAPGPDRSLSERVRAALRNHGSLEVSIAGDRDLNAFAQSIALCALERDLLGAIASNRVRFRLAGAPAPVAGVAPPAPGPRGGAPRVFHWEAGVLNEAKIARIAKDHDRLVLGAKAVLTPLAKDRARKLELEMVRQTP